MPDDINPSSPQPSPAIQPAPSLGPAVDHVSNAAVPVPPAEPPAAPYSAADFARWLLRSTLNVLIGAAVGAAVGFLLNGLLYLLNYVNDWSRSLLLVTGAGLLAGVFFNRFIVHLLRLAPKTDSEARTASPKAPGAAPADAPAPDGVREIVETVVFVVVLVLLLKSFIAEAFVIPTGSMAETLLGYQKMAVCPQCGYSFPVNSSQQVDPQGGKPDWVRGCTCPNCRERVRFVAHDDYRLFGLLLLSRTYVDPDTRQARGAPSAPDEIMDPDANSGDRVLVSKFAYDLWDTPPNRLDVVVFKFPGGNPEPFPISGPFKDGVPMNYIKRLIGLPGETIAIHNGNLYILSPDKGLKYDDLEKEIEKANREELAKSGKEIDAAKRAELAKQLWEKKYMHQNESEALKRFKNGEFVILRKPPDAILSERRIVWDNDHPAKDLTGPRWARWVDRDKEAAWAADNAHGFKLTAPSDYTVRWLGYRHLLRDGEEKPELITDFMGYNTWEGQRSGRRLPGENWVGDLILDAEVQADQAQGELTLELSKGVDRFRASWDLSTGLCTLWRLGDEKPLDSKPTSLKGGGTHKVRFANVDQRLTVWVDDSLPFGDGVSYDAPKTEGPTKENDLEPAGVGLKGTGGTVRGLKLWRDTYYTTGNNSGDSPSVADADTDNPPYPRGTPSDEHVNFSQPKTWDRLRNLEPKTLYVQPEHYLCLGDNSPESSDGRSWGLVPKRLLLGKALAVYYPFDRFGRIR